MIWSVLGMLTGASIWGVSNVMEDTFWSKIGIATIILFLLYESLTYHI